MAQLKSILHYPQEYFEFIAQVNDGCDVRVPMPDLRTATRFRGHFYSFVGVLKQEAARRPNDAILARAAEGANLVMVKVDSDCVTFTHRENSWQARAARSALFADREMPDDLRTKVQQHTEALVEDLLQKGIPITNAAGEEIKDPDDSRDPITGKPKKNPYY